MAKIARLQLLAEHEIEAIKDASLAILRDTGVMVHHDEMLRLLGRGRGEGGHRPQDRPSAREARDGLRRAGRQAICAVRPRPRIGPLDSAMAISCSCPARDSTPGSTCRPGSGGPPRSRTRARRSAWAMPWRISRSSARWPSPKRSRRNTGTWSSRPSLSRAPDKPTRSWVRNGATARYILEIYRTIAGGDAALRARPMVEAFLEPISPLQLPRDGLDIVREFAQAGQPVSIGPMAMTSGTAPGTLAGTLAQENAEILAGIVITQLLAPGTPITYGGIPHIMDPRTGICSFGSPEQGIMAVAMIQIAHSYGFPVYVNVGLTDAKLPDAQAGAEKAATLLLGVLAGADTFGHCGICGTDHAGSLLWLAFDDELMSYIKRIARGFAVDDEHLATDVIHAVGPAGNFLAEEHTVRHFREELWLPRPVWTRQPYDPWQTEGATSFADRLRTRVTDILATHQPQPLDESLSQEIDRIVASARRELG